ncbi:MAG: hypothetical protein H6736_08170 [Alphaproteobacteria bacterium]|nr:hypothetical protein [Alphaproteobacteria bacterium]
MNRTLLPLTALLFLGCKGGDPPPDVGVDPAVEIPDHWNSLDGRVVMRLTNASSTDTSVRRALGSIFNGDPLDPSKPPVDPMQLLMRGAPKDPGTGAWMPPIAGLSEAEQLAGSAVDQALAFKNRIADADGSFTPEEAVDACGNPLLMTVLTPEALATVMPEVVGGEPWPSSCASPDGCAPEVGTWDVAIGERRPDGMIDMVLNVLPVFDTDPVQPGVFGPLTALFFTAQTPGLPMVPLFANMRRMQINLTNVWQLHSEYTDPRGTAEVYVFPHRARRMDMADIFVFPEGYDRGEDYWAAMGYEESLVPFGVDEAMAVGVDQTAAGGRELVDITKANPLLAPTLGDLLNYQIGASLACPGVKEPAWIKEGPLEFFFCPDGDIGPCLARNDMDEGACMFVEEPEPTPLDLFPPAFVRYDTAAGVVPVPAANLPAFLSSAGPSGTAQVQIEVTADSALYVFDPLAITAATGPTNQPVTLPTPVVNDHCTEGPTQKLDVGTAWPPGTYTLTVDLTAAVLDETDATYNTWFYFTNTAAWMPN